MEDDLKWKTTSNIKSEITQQLLVRSSPNFKLSLIWQKQTLQLLQMKMTSNWKWPPMEIWNFAFEIPLYSCQKVSILRNHFTWPLRDKPYVLESVGNIEWGQHVRQLKIESACIMLHPLCLSLPLTNSKVSSDYAGSSLSQGKTELNWVLWIAIFNLFNFQTWEITLLNYSLTLSTVSKVHKFYWF